MYLKNITNVSLILKYGERIASYFTKEGYTKNNKQTVTNLQQMEIHFAL